MIYDAKDKTNKRKQKEEDNGLQWNWLIFSRPHKQTLKRSVVTASL